MLKRVLIVDDNSANLYLLESLLKGYGLEVTTAENGQDALNQARLNPPDLIVTDILMPVMDGYTLCRHWKSDEQLKHIPFIFHTATYTGPGDEDFALSLGADRFVIKPQDPSVLMSILKEVLDDRAKGKEHETKPLGEEMEFFRRHNEILFRKLEKKMLDLEIANKELKLMEERYRLIIENAMDVIVTVGPDHNILTVSPSVERMLGYKPQHFIGRPVSDLLSPEDHEQAVLEMNSILKGATIPRTIYPFIAKDGTIAYGELSGAPILRDGRIIGLISIVRDITERRRAEDALRQSDANLRRSQEIAKLGSWIWDSAGRISWSDEMYRIYGVSPETFVLNLESFISLIHPDDRSAMKAWMDAFQAEERPGELEFRVVLPDGTVRLISGRGEMIHDAEGRPIHMSGTAQDITERKRAEAAHERLIAAIEQAGESVIITDPAGTIQYVNPAFTAVTGYTRQEALGQSAHLPKIGEQNEADYGKIWETITSGRTWQGRIVNKRKDGTFYTEDATISPVFDAAGQIVNYIAVKRDITEHLRLESQLMQAQKMDSVGRLAGGVAHDFNNMLSVILGFTELALRKVDANEPLYANLKEVLNAAGRSADIVRQLLAFARKQNIAPKVLDLNETVEGTLKILRRLIGEDIDLAWLPAAGLWPVRMDPSQLDQILTNLCANARDAIADVGKITIETGNVALDKAFCTDHVGFVPGEYVLLAVSDDGCGMDRETLEKVFEPFFTTKGEGKGTGMGLATVYGIVKQNNGFIEICSEPGEGTAFKIYMPRHMGQGIEIKAETAAEIRAGLSETVLVVEDEVSLLELTRELLTGLGYTVLTAGTPSEALRLIEKHTGEIQLLITDVILPEMNGRDLAERLRAARPGMKCLFMSGYSADMIAHRGVLDEGVRFIQKPFTAEALAEKVRDVLDR